MSARIHRRTLLGLLGASSVPLLPSLASAAEGVAVILHPKNPVTSMTRAQLASLFKALSTQFPGGGRAKAINLPLGHPAREMFDRVVLGLSPKSVERYWIDSRIRTGNGPPPKLPNPTAVIQSVAGDPSSIGYVPLAEVTPQIKVVARVEGGNVAGWRWTEWG